jgi:FkbM family methyltransferase
MPDYSFVRIRYSKEVRKLYYRRNSSDEKVIESVLRQRQYSLARSKRASELRTFLSEQAANGAWPLIVDAGANIGAASLHFSIGYPHARIVAVEPEPENFRLLAKNVEGLNVLPVQAALASTQGFARILNPDAPHWAYQTEAVGDDERDADSIARITIDQILSSQPPGYFPFIVKVDIEGAEADLFSANTDWLARVPVVMIEPHDWLLPGRATFTPFLKCVSQLDRDFVIAGESIFSIANDFNVCRAPR